MEPKQLEVLQSLKTELINELEVCAEYITQDLDSINKMLDALTKVNGILNPPEPITIQQLQPSQLLQQPKQDQPQPTQQTQQDTNLPKNTKPKFKFADGAVVRGREYLMEANNAKATVKEIEDVWAEPTNGVQSSTESSSNNRVDVAGDPDDDRVPATVQQPITRQQLQQPYSVPNAKGLTHDKQSAAIQDVQQFQGEAPVVIPDAIPNTDIIQQQFFMEAQNQALRELENMLGRTLSVSEIEMMRNGQMFEVINQPSVTPILSQPHVDTIQRLSIYSGRVPFPPIVQALAYTGFMDGMM